VTAMRARVRSMAQSYSFCPVICLWVSGTFGIHSLCLVWSNQWCTLLIALRYRVERLMMGGLVMYYSTETRLCSLCIRTRVRVKLAYV
jgi:hypothetical protein